VVGCKEYDEMEIILLNKWYLFELGEFKTLYSFEASNGFDIDFGS